MSWGDDCEAEREARPSAAPQSSGYLRHERHKAEGREREAHARRRLLAEEEEALGRRADRASSISRRCLLRDLDGAGKNSDSI